MRISDWSSDVCSSDLDVDAAVASAEEGFAVWSAMGGTERGRVLHEAQRILRARNRELAELEVLDCGKPIQEIGRATCRERVCQYVLISVVAVELKKKITTSTEQQHEKRERNK